MVVVAGCQKDAYWFLHLTSSIPYFLFFIKLKIKKDKTKYTYTTKRVKKCYMS